MSGLKINFHKSEVVAFGYEPQEQQNIANWLNCKLGTMPIKYLGFPISDRALYSEAFKGILEKMRKKLQPWKVKLLSSGGRLVLTNSVLSSMPTYMMGIYNIQEGVYAQMDTIRSQFFWSGDCNKFKYHMVEWENVCLPKDFGGLGITNTRVLNEALLLKWVWRLYRNDEGDTCCQLLKNKYLKASRFLFVRGAEVLTSGKVSIR